LEQLKRIEETIKEQEKKANEAVEAYKVQVGK